jgi:heterodisulfide reductase subunit A-like polyferredoxin
MAGAAKPPGPIKVGLTSSAAAQIAAATALSDNKEASTKIEHWVEFEFVDKAGKPISGVHYKFNDPDGKESEGVLKPDGRICRDSLSAGQCQAQLFSVSNAKWSKVKLTADVEGFEDGTSALIQIYRRDIKGPDVLVATMEKQVRSGKIEGEWEYI